MERLARISLCLLAGVAAVSCVAGRSPSRADSAAAVDKLFAQWNKGDSPGCSVGISRDGVPIYEHGYGMANLELGVPITPSSVLSAASISKQFTAAGILLLVERGRLSLDDDARKYVAELPDYGQPLTIRHLLNHTNGLRDAFALLGLGAPREDGVSVNDQIVGALGRQRALNFTPGSDYQYNNGGYALLASIVQRVSGRSLRAFAEANIFKPLGMTQTHFHDDPAMIVPNRASGYHRNGSALQLANHAHDGRVVGNAGLFTTARDLLRWEQNFADVRVGSPALLAGMQTATVLTTGERVPYGFGLSIDNYRGLRAIGHGGGDLGVRSYVVRYPEQRFAVAVLCNVDDIDTGALTQRVADVYLADSFTEPAAGASAAPSRVSLSSQQLESLAGLYRDPSRGTFGRIFNRDGKVIATTNAGEEGDMFELTPISATRLVLAGTPVVLEVISVANGRAQEIRVTGDGPKPVVMQRVTASFTPSAAELRAFAGDYVSPELDVTYTIDARESGLVVHVAGRSDIILRPVFPDAFHGAAVDVLEFSRDADGSVTGFTVNNGGLHGLRFDRITRGT